MYWGLSIAIIAGIIQAHLNANFGNLHSLSSHFPIREIEV